MKEQCSNSLNLQKTNSDKQKELLTNGFPQAGDVFVARPPVKIESTLLEMQEAMPYRNFVTSSG